MTRPRFKVSNRMLFILASTLFVTTEALLTAYFVQSFLTRWGYDSFWSEGFRIVLASSFAVFVTTWYFLSQLSSTLSGLPVSRLLPRYSFVFLPFTLLLGYGFVPAYHRQNIASYYTVAVLILVSIISSFLFFEAWKGRKKSLAHVLVDWRVVFSFLCSLAVAGASFKLHDHYLLRSLSSDIHRALHVNSSLLAKVSMPVMVARVPGTFSWKTRVRQGSVFQVSAFYNEDVRIHRRKLPMRYEVRMKRVDGENRTISRGQLHFGETLRVRHDLSGGAGEVVTFELEMKEPVSFRSFFSSLHVLFRPYLWAPGMSERSRSTVLPVYWSEPKVYLPRQEDELNILLIVVDCLRADHVGCYGYGIDTTPTVDGLARQGVLFKRSISQAPWTLPSFLSIYSARLPTDYLSELRREGKLLQQLDLLELLRENGFYTMGIFTNINTAPSIGMDQSFDEHYYKEVADAKEVSDWARWWIDNNADKKFFCVLHYMDAHPPYPQTLEGALREKLVGASSAKLMERCRGGTPYDGKIAFVDAQIKRVLDRIRALGLLDNTLIIFTADHGEEFFEHGGKCHGHTLYDELLHVPLIFTLPSRLPKGKVVEAQVRSIDILPTVFEISGIDFDGGVAAGESLYPLMMGRASDDRDAVSSGLSGEFYAGSPFLSASIHSGRYKLIFNPNHRRTELYDIVADPGERVDLSETKPQLKETLMDRMKAYLEKNPDWNVNGAEPPAFDEETKRALRALGYIE